MAKPRGVTDLPLRHRKCRGGLRRRTPHPVAQSAAVRCEWDAGDCEMGRMKNCG